MTGPMVVVVSGTGTGVGKTWVATELITQLSGRGIPVCAVKPVQSFEPSQGPTDAQLLSAAAGVTEHQVTLPHRSYPLAMAPPIAAALLGRPAFTLSDLMAELIIPSRGVVLVEGVGGPRSPLASDADTVSLAAALGADAVVLVAGAGLGAINAVALSAEAFAPTPVITLLNRFDEASAVHRENLRWLTTVTGLDVEVEIHSLAQRMAVAAGFEARPAAGATL